MFTFLRLHGKWVDLDRDGLVLKSTTPATIVDLFNAIKQEYEVQKRNGKILD